MKEEILKFYLEQYPLAEREKNKETYYWLSGFLTHFFESKNTPECALPFGV